VPLEQWLQRWRWAKRAVGKRATPEVKETELRFLDRSYAFDQK
jgi:hypothetical protein